MVLWGQDAWAGGPDFDRDIGPILIARCVECHNGSDLKGELDLTQAATALRRDPPVIVPGDLEQSLLWQHVSSDQMPPESPLTVEEKQLIENWILSGATWGNGHVLDRFGKTTERRAGTDWWSLQPITRPALPTVRANWGETSIDRFILASLERSGLEPSRPAEMRTLIRRVYFDLLGLPPTPAELQAALRDSRPDAYERLVDRLLASPHYGERWARHWLDVARYTESQGFEYDRFRPNAWHYRDYVIDAFNRDKQYNTFVQEQVAGDVPNGVSSPEGQVSTEGIIATSLLVCGPWDQAGNSQANVTQKMITREDELEDLVSVVAQSFLGLTVNCARCHSHKFDPISHEDYSRFKAIFAGVRHGERSILSDRQIAARDRQVAQLQQQIKTLEQQAIAYKEEVRLRAISRHVEPARQSLAVPAPVARWTFDGEAQDMCGNHDGQLFGGATIRQGRLVLTGDAQYLKSRPLQHDLAEKTLEAWVMLPNLDQQGGGVLAVETEGGQHFDAIVYAEREPRKWIAGSASFERTQDLMANREDSASGQLIHVAIVYNKDHRISVYRNGKRYGQPYQQHSLQVFRAGQSHFLLGLRHQGGARGYLQAEIESATVYDQGLSEADVNRCYQAGPAGAPFVTPEQITSATTPEDIARSKAVDTQLETLRAEVTRQLQPHVTYAGVRAQPEPVHRLPRGDVTKPAEIVSPAPLSAIRHLPNDWGLAPDSPEGERRLHLARWLTDPRNPLTARVMVNRLWHYHFGRGIVETPNDFGFNGARPTHPELLDWLAAELIAGSPAWSLKRIQRMIVTSATYRQSSTWHKLGGNQDADNTLLWRFAPRRLEGESVRDSLLAVSGALQVKMGGPSFQPFVVTNFGSDFYQPIDPVGPEFNRRTIYRAHINSGKSALMDALDCPDPSIKAPVRRVTTTPLAALALMNNSFVLRQAKLFADRIARECEEPTDQIARAYEFALARPPHEHELQAGIELVRQHNLSTLCWVLLNTTEFAYVQ